jgi:glycerophosphoryl diester phosphodiesterase
MDPVRSRYLDGPVPAVMAHRGFSRDGLENSMAAFAAAVQLGVRYLETDVHSTADGVLVAFHDRRLDRVTDRTGPIAAQPWSAVRQARIGGREPVPLLEDVLGTWPDVLVNIDVKALGAVQPLVDVLVRTKALDRVCVASFSDARRRRVLRRLPDGVATSAGLSTVAAMVVVTRLRLPARTLDPLTRRVDCLQVPVDRYGVPVVEPRLLAAARRAGLPVHVWTINDPVTMERLLDLGASVLITDRADLACEIVRRRGAPGPRGSGSSTGTGQ